jgi:hypothetical protein
MTRLIRRIASAIAIFALAFAQLAVSAYACPMDMPAGAHQTAETGESGCDMPGTPNLCERHCDYGASSVQASPAPAIAPAPVAAPWSEPFISQPFTRAHAWLQPARIEPPPLVRFGVLRI